MTPSWQRMWHPWGWLLLLLAVITVMPGMDFRVTGWFYDPQAGFAAGQNAVTEFVRRHIPRLIIVSAIVFAMVTLTPLLRGGQALANMTLRKAGFLAASLIIGPGLIVESLLKPNWGRARPDEIVAFGGTLPYTPPLWLSDACSHNCSFASGHAAVAFWVTAYAYLVPSRYYRSAMAAGLLFGLAVGLVRIMQGAHFFSDVIYAGAIVAAVNALLARLILNHRDNTS